MSGGRTTENEIARAVLRILAATASGDATISYIRNRIPDYVNLTESDRRPSETRKGEEVWEQQVRNIRSHHTAEGNYIHEGYLTAPSRGRLRITDAGRKRINS